MVKIYLVRHGETLNPKHIIYGYLPMPLSNKGKTQARKAGVFLKDKNIGVIFSSPQERTLESAKIISKVVSKGRLKIKIDKDLRESGFGQLMKGMTLEQAEGKYPKIWQAYWHRPAAVMAGESLEKMAKRFMRAIDKAIKKHSDKNLVFVSHRDPILAVLLKISKRSFNDFHKVKSICDEGSICEIVLMGKKLVNRTYLAQ